MNGEGGSSDSPWTRRDPAYLSLSGISATT